MLMIPELDNMWQEKVELEKTEDQSKDPFEPAIESKFDPEHALIHIDL